jgi:hypothetical protein
MNAMLTLPLFSTLAIGIMPAYLISKQQATDRQRKGAIEMAIWILMFFRTIDQPRNRDEMYARFVGC